MVRYDEWLRGTRGGSRVEGATEQRVGGDDDGSEVGDGLDASLGVECAAADGGGEEVVSDVVGFDGLEAAGVSQADWAEALQAVGSHVPRQADGGYLNDEERAFVQRQTGLLERSDA